MIPAPGIPDAGYSKIDKCGLVAPYGPSTIETVAWLCPPT